MPRFAGDQTANSSDDSTSSDQLLQQILQSVHEGVIVYDTDLKYRVWNHFMEVLSGRSREEVLNQNAEEVFPFLRDTGVIDLLNGALRGVPWQSVEFPYESHEGKSVWLLATVAPLKNSLNEIVGVIETVRDITSIKESEQLLQQAKKHFEQAQKIGRNGSWQLVQGAKTGSWSKEMYRLFNWDENQDPPEFEEFVQMIHPDDREQLLIYHANLIQNNVPFEIEFRTNPENGPIRHMFNRIGVHIDEETGVATYAGTTQDITELRVIEQEVIDLAKFPGENPNPVFRVSREGKLLFQNTASKFLTSQWQGDDEKLIGPIVDWVCEAYGNGEVLRKECNCGDAVYSLTFKAVQESEYVNVYALDITEHKFAEFTARDNERKFRLLLNHLDDAVFLHPFLEEGFAPFEEVNEVACRRYGYTEDEFKKLTALDITLTTDAGIPERRDFREKLLTSGKYTFESIHVTKDGRQFPVEINFNIVDIKNRKYILAVVRDCTERKQEQTERDRLHSQLIQIQKIESIGRLAGGVAHDFNNMLGVILGNLEFALRRVDSDQPIREDLLEAQKAAVRSADLTRQLLAFARKQTVTPKQIDLNNIISGMFGMLQRTIGEDIKLIWIPKSGLWTTRIDPGQIDQVLVNLCVNAKDAISADGKVIIETSNIVLDAAYCARHTGFVPGEYVMLIVTDNGCGIDDDVKRYIYEPFFTTKKLGEGTGLGLATVYGIVKQNKGFIDVYSEPGSGSSFKIYLPRYVGKQDTASMEEYDRTEHRGGETILLVEDEKSILELTRRMLESLGYSVLDAATPGAAIQLAEKHAGKIHLLLTDVVMPEMDGHDLAKRLLSLYPDLKRLFVSGYTANVIAHRGVLEEGVHFLQKPFSIRDLGKKVREVLDDDYEV